MLSICDICNRVNTLAFNCDENGKNVTAKCLYSHALPRKEQMETKRVKTNGANGGHQLAVDSIYEALLQLMEKKPYSEIKITDIVERAGVSRMAYYRNYQSKDEILTKRLEKNLDDFYSRILDDKSKGTTSMSRIEFMTAFFEELQKDHILQTVISAGLLDKLFELHRNFMYNIYRYVLEIDMDKKENIKKLYYDMGGIVGLLLYCKDQGFHADSHELAELVMRRS